MEEDGSRRIEGDRRREKEGNMGKKRERWEGGEGGEGWEGGGRGREGEGENHERGSG